MFVRQDGVEFIIIACDGLWDTVEYQQAVDFVAKKRKKGKSPSEVSWFFVCTEETFKKIN